MKRVAILTGILLACGAFAQAAQTYPASGLVLQIDRTHTSIEISCEAIPGYMEAMVMRLPVRKAEVLKGLKPGSR